MDRRKLIWALAGLLALLAAVLGYVLARPNLAETTERRSQAAEAKQESSEDVCASRAAYDRLKALLFEQAVRLDPADRANFDRLAASSVVRMEDPVVESRDEKLDATTCGGHLILELPPGAERGFGGERRLTADVQYSARPAVDGSGLVYRMTGADPIVQRLAAFELQGQPLEPTDSEAAETNEMAPAEAEPAPSAPPPAAAPKAEPLPVASSNPSFNCRYARTRGEIMVCRSDRLAARDRAMASLYEAAWADANPRARNVLRSTRNRFLAYRDRCPDEACVAEAYEGRMREIRDILADLN